MKLIIGLGNPGIKYEKTRHNVGFFLIDSFCIENNILLNQTKFEGNFQKSIFFGENFLIGKPMTFMNLSGNFVSKIVNFYKILPQNILVIHDDKDIELGKYKFQFGGSSAGQNGIEDIINKLATEKFSRLRIGIGSQSIKNITSFVMGNFQLEEKKIIIDMIQILNEGIKEFIKTDIKNTMNKFN